MSSDQTFYSVTLGDLIQLFSVVGGVFAVVFHVGARTKAIENVAASAKEDIVELKEELTKLKDVLVQIAVQKERLDMIDKRMDDIAHGRITVGVERWRRSGPQGDK